MKLSIALLMAFPTMAAAFAPVSPRAAFVTSLKAEAKPAKSKEEDLELTRQLLAKSMGLESEPAQEPAKEQTAASVEEK